MNIEWQPLYRILRQQLHILPPVFYSLAEEHWLRRKCFEKEKWWPGKIDNSTCWSQGYTFHPNACLGVKSEGAKENLPCCWSKRYLSESLKITLGLVVNQICVNPWRWTTAIYDHELLHISQTSVMYGKLPLSFFFFFLPKPGC